MARVFLVLPARPRLLNHAIPKYALSGYYGDEFVMDAIRKAAAVGFDFGLQWRVDPAVLGGQQLHGGLTAG
jgi:hypothetical protein